MVSELKTNAMASASPLPLIGISSSPNTTDTIIPLTLPIATKLNQNNYLTWKSQILSLLHGYNLSHFLDSPAPPAAISAADGSPLINLDYLPWHRQDQLLLGWIRSSLTESIQTQVVSCVTTTDLWSTLLSSFSSASRARLTDLRRQLQTISKGSLSYSEYLQKILIIILLLLL
jgi:gag-polypeptide of LTR copia-type